MEQPLKGLRAQVGSGNRPILSVLHEVGRYQPDIGVRVGKRSLQHWYAGGFHDSGIPANLWRIFSEVQLRKSIKRKGVFQTILQTADCFGEPALIEPTQILCLFAGKLMGRGQLDIFQLLCKNVLVFMENVCKNIPHKMDFTPLPACAGEAFTDRCHQAGMASEITRQGVRRPRAYKLRNKSRYASSDSSGMGSMARIFRCPCSSTPQITSTAMLAILPSRRTFSYSASTHKTG